ncbi:MAG: serine/threonine-protein kinase [Micromonosporaceae bacterium]
MSTLVTPAPATAAPGQCVAIDLDHADPRMAAASRPTERDDTVDSWPLRVTDPVSVDGYRLVSRLGVGGMADVFYAVAPSGRPVAVKVLRATDEAPQTCQREYELTHAVDADCTAPALGYGMSPAGPYLVTAYLPGYRCGATLVGSSAPAGQLRTLGSALARVLAAIHANGVVHCDVKPSNLLVRGHDVRLIDFGIARRIGELYLNDGTVQCTRGWAAPEQLRTAPATPATDVFAWGCLLAHLASGVHPFAGPSDEEWYWRIQSAEPDLSGLPGDLEEVIRWTLMRDPQDRPTAADLVAAGGFGHGPAGAPAARRRIARGRSRPDVATSARP